MKFAKGNTGNNRRRWLYWVAGILPALVLWRFIKKVEKKNEPVKMLTEDGQLVEVDPRYLSKGQKIRPEEIHTWVKRKK
ncbi:hypothetical protein [Chryseolinea soli]|uniref:Uncharacterized protein n=1 Tax=Chryseolinea soli TaxID=2321403 RepID=A0A385SZC0_9BACT|nr:hypothetical protein [Chryseolinea soli]AYB35150.1 hypothetical protein D4L85_33225 [Chryseolinea soli]